MLNPPRITVCIPHRNGWATLEATLAGLARQDYSRELWQAVIVDNGSTDDSLDRAAEMFSEIAVVRPGSNLGFGAGCNFGVLSRLGADVYAFLNSDAVPEPDWLSRGAAAFADESVGCVGGKTLFQHRRWSVEFALPVGASVQLRRVAFEGVRVDSRRFTCEAAPEIEDGPELTGRIEGGSVLRFALMLDEPEFATCQFELVNPHSESVPVS
ncbi:MAG TPA: glycosyltransferase, partial [Planctomycetaceae bacterium]|nr:glycosyltransferase [Planctomycetaceae bacterium]